MKSVTKTMSQELLGKKRANDPREETEEPIRPPGREELPNRQPGREDRPIPLLRYHPISPLNESQSYLCTLCDNLYIPNYKKVCDHFVDEHPYRINYLKTIIPFDDLELLKCRIFVKQVLSKHIISNEKAKHNGKSILVNLFFNPTTYQFVDCFKKGMYSKEYSRIFCNLYKKVILDFVDYVRKYMDDVEKMVETLPYEIPAFIKNKNELANINFENYCDLNFYKNETKRAFFFVDNPHVDSGISDDNLKRGDIFSDSSSESDPKKFPTVSEIKFVNKINKLNESDREKAEDFQNYINENNYRWIINEDYSRKLIHPEPKGTKIFAENYHDIISKYYDHKKKVLDEYFSEDKKKYYEDNHYGSSNNANKNNHRRRLSKKFFRRYKFKKNFHKKEKKRDDSEIMSLKESDEDIFGNKIIKVKLDHSFHEEDLHSMKDFDNQSCIFMENNINSNNVNTNISSNNIIKKDDHRNSVNINDLQGMNNLKDNQKESFLELSNVLHEYYLYQKRFGRYNKYRNRNRSSKTANRNVDQNSIAINENKDASNYENDIDNKNNILIYNDNQFGSSNNDISTHKEVNNEILNDIKMKKEILNLNE